jgi:5'(3')-deoxyribonucleotidase
VRRLVIAIDCDDVLLPSSESIVAHYHREYGTNVHLDNFYERDPAQWGVESLDDVYERIRLYFQSDAFPQEVKPFDDAVRAVRELSTRHELHLVTGRGPAVEAVTHAMVDAYFNGHFMSVEHTGAYLRGDGTMGRRSKGEVCAAIKADILIDDNLDHARSVLESGIETVLLYGSYAWTKKEELARTLRCETWNDILIEIGRLEHAASR